MKVFFYTLGCKVNQYETQEMLELFGNAGFESTDEPKNADIIVINSCTVTAESVRKLRQSARKFKSLNPDALLAVTGCASQAEPQKIIDDLPEADIILGNNNNINIVSLCKTCLSDKTKVIEYCEHKSGDAFKGSGITRFDGHTRAFLKIQDGCDRFCSYCLIPTARGRSRSKKLEDIDRELSSLEKNGYEEIVFVGINLSDYGKGTEYSLPDALALASKYDGIKRIRLGSLEPDHITDEMIERLSKLPKLCPQFHISVQSGCNSVLKRMNRHYTAEEYKELAAKLRASFDDCTITTDILVGFPTETEEDFEVTAKFAKEVRFEKIHIFPYSKRDGTPAAKMPQLSNAVKNDRAHRLGLIAADIRKEYMKSQVGSTVEVLFETEHGEYSEGYTKNYTPVRIYDKANRKGRTLAVKITGYTDECCIAEE